MRETLLVVGLQSAALEVRQEGLRLVKLLELEKNESILARHYIKRAMKNDGF